MAGQAPAAKLGALTESTHLKAACAFDSAVRLPVAWYSRTSATASHMTVSLLPVSADAQECAVPASARSSGSTAGSWVRVQRRYSTYVSESEPQSRFLVKQSWAGTHMCHRPVPL